MLTEKIAPWISDHDINKPPLPLLRIRILKVSSGGRWWCRHVSRRVVDQVVDLRLKASNVFPRMFLLLMLIFDASWFLKFKNLHKWHNTPWFSSLFARRKCSDPPQKIPTDTTIPRRRMCSGIPYHPTVAATNKYLLFFVWRSKVYSWQNKTRQWFQIFFIFTPIWGRFPFWLIFFRWVETTNQKMGDNNLIGQQIVRENPPVKLSRNRRKPWTNSKPCTSILYWHPYRYIWPQHSWYGQ